MAPTPPAFGEPCHLVQGISAAGTLLQFGASNVLAFVDNLTTGPCSLDASEHERWRREYWDLADEDEYERGFFTPTGLFSFCEEHADAPLVVWISTNWGTYLFTWWLTSVLAAAESTRETWIAGVLPWADPPQDLSGLRVGCITGDQLTTLFAHAEPMREDFVRSACSLWTSFCAPTPTTFEVLRATPNEWFPDLAVQGSNYAALLPQALDHGTYLSALDTLLLGFLTNEWRRPREILRPAAHQASFLDFMYVYGDVTLWHRFHEFASAPRPLAEERDTGRDASAPNLEFRLTPHGAAILAEGLGNWTSLPRMSVGGHSVYHSTERWVCHGFPDNIRLQPLDG